MWVISIYFKFKQKKNNIKYSLPRITPGREYSCLLVSNRHYSAIDTLLVEPKG